MQAKTPNFDDKADLEAKEEQLKQFVRSGLAGAAGNSEPLLLLARAPTALAARAVFALSRELAEARVPALVLFASGSLVTTGERWNLSFDPGFAHEARLLRDIRYLDGHEQIVCGTGHAWYGDSMRREPDKRDAFSSFHAADAIAGSRARRTFNRLWSGAERIYIHEDVHASDTSPPSSDIVCDTDIAAQIAATLSTWSPESRH